MGKGDKGTGAAASLSTSLWAEILQHVPQQHRLRQCSLVCTAWASAAAQATVHLVMHKRVKNDTVRALQSWLQLYAGQLQSLELAAHHLGIFGINPAKVMLQLPLDKLTKLQRLQLKYFNLQLPGEEDGKGSRSATDSKDSSTAASHCAADITLSSLQHLALTNIELTDISSFMQLTKAPQLTSLQLERIRFPPPAFSSGSRFDNIKAVVQAADQQLAEALPRLLQQLPQLSVLKLPGFPLTDSAMQQLSTMQGLQELEIAHKQGMPACDLQLLPSSITQLTLHEADPDSPSLPPELPQLSGLQHLDLHDCAVPVKVLGCLTQLRLLCMHECILLPRTMPEDWPNTQGTEALLEVLHSLKLLQDLRFVQQALDTDNPQHFSALTASSHLTQLSMKQTYDMPLPEGAVQHMFPLSRQMQLQHLTISTDLKQAKEWCVGSADFNHISSCCPGLKYLDINGSVEPGADLSVLQLLPQTCTTLRVGGAAFTDDAAPFLSQLTQLRNLSWSRSPKFTEAGLEKLVGLELEKLHVRDCGMFQGGPRNRRPRMIDLECDPQLGSVWQQLAVRFRDKPATAQHLKLYMAAAREQQLRVDNSSLREQLADRDQQLAAKDQQLADRDQQLALKEQQLADREQQLACSQAEVERLKQQLAAADAV